MLRTPVIAMFMFLAGCLSCGATRVTMDASVTDLPSDSFEVRARDTVPHPTVTGAKVVPKWVQATPVAKNYFVAPIDPFTAFCLDLGLDPVVVVRSGNREFAGRLVDSDFPDELVLIRADAPAKTIDLKNAPQALVLLKEYFGSWGRGVKDKPRL